MRAHILTIPERAPAWVKQGFDDYAKRLTHHLPLTLTELALGQRGKNADTRRAIADEGQRMQLAVPKQARVIALDGRGDAWSSEALARHLAAWMQDGRDVALLIGGADGLDEAFKQEADDKLRLSSLTLPHGMARLLLCEQLYRAVSVLKNHPYHREG